MRINQYHTSSWCASLLVLSQALLGVAFPEWHDASLKVISGPAWGLKQGRQHHKTPDLTPKMEMSTKGPIASRKKYQTEDGRIDYYHWLRDPNWPDVKEEEILNYLMQENVYTDEHLPKELVNKLFNEMKGRIQKMDYTVPYLDGGYEYYSYILEDQQYWVHARKAVGSDKEEIILDENELVIGNPYLSIANFRVSPDHKRILYASDFSGDERYIVHVKEIESGEIIDGNVDNVIYGQVEWDKYGKGFFYTPAGEFGRPDRVRYHEISRRSEDDTLIYHEKDPSFSVDIEKSKSKDYLIVGSGNPTVVEYRYIPTDSPYRPPEIIHDRSHNNFYTTTHYGESFFLRINDVSSNYRVVEVKIGDANKTLYEFVPPSEDRYIQDMFAYEDHLVLLTREKGLAKMEIINLANNSTRKIDFEDESYV